MVRQLEYLKYLLKTLHEQPVCPGWIGEKQAGKTCFSNWKRKEQIWKRKEQKYTCVHQENRNENQCE
jgi:hypothetical protein